MKPLCDETYPQAGWLPTGCHQTVTLCAVAQETVSGCDGDKRLTTPLLGCRFVFGLTFLEATERVWAVLYLQQACVIEMRR